MDQTAAAAGFHANAGEGGNSTGKKPLPGDAVPIKSELSASGEQDLSKLDRWYCKERREQIYPGDSFFAVGVPLEEQMRDIIAHRASTSTRKSRRG